MAEERMKRAPHTASRIDLREDGDIRWWTKDLGVTRERLEQLVRDHGPSVDALRRALWR